MTVILFHPTSRRLLRWAEAEKPARVERHIQRCDRCASKLETLTQLAPSGVSLLRAALTPASGVEDRVLEGVQSDLAEHETLSVLADLFGIGWASARLLLDEDGEYDNG